METVEAAARPAMTVEQILRHPELESAVLAAAAGAVELHHLGAAMSWLLGDRARALFGHRLLYLDATHDPADPRSGILPSRVQADCRELALCSPGRAAAILALMQAGGYLAAAQSPQDRRVKRLVATPKLWAMQRQRVALQLNAVGRISPASAEAARRLGDPVFDAALVRGLNDYFVAGYRVLDYAPRLRLFADRSAAMMMLFALLIEAARQGNFPLTAPVALPIAELSRRFRVSRTHILRLLREAEAEELLRREGESIVPAPVLGQSLVDLFAAVFHIIDQAAVGALDAA